MYLRLQGFEVFLYGIFESDAIYIRELYAFYEFLIWFVQ